MTNPNGRFGIHGGQYIPETLMNAVIELEEAYNHYKNDPEFNRELTELLNEYAGRPSRLYYAKKMTEDLGGAKIYLKREDLTHTGAHKINNVLGQALLAKKMGKTRLIAETGAERLVMGFPRNMDGTEGPRAALYREFAALLEQTTGMKPVLWDERRTTIDAHNILFNSGKNAKQRKKVVDAVAASLILEGYLTFKKSH